MATVRWDKIWVLLLVLAGASALMFVALSAPHTQRPVLQWQPVIEGVEHPTASEWRDGAPSRAAGPVAWVRTLITVDTDHRLDTSALQLSGAFSANVWINGVPAAVGKGAASVHSAEEVAGPIDAVIPLGNSLRPGLNEVVLLVSAHQMPFGLQGAIHGLSLSVAGASPSRPLSHYGIAITQMGLVATMAVAFLLIGIRSHNRSLIWVSIAAAALTVALGAETSRVWWNYLYPLHVVRQGGVWASFAMFGAALQLAAWHRWGGDRRPLIWLVGLYLSASLVALLVTARLGVATLANLGLVGIGLALTAWKPARAGDSGARHLLFCQVPMLVLALRGDPFLDNDVYVLGACMMCAFAWERPPAQDGPRQQSSDEIGEIMLIRAEGNYAHITSVNGSRRLVRKSLSAFAIEAPLMRVHRSYVVNLHHARRLLSQTGSRYLLELTDGTTVPVSRKLVVELRTRLAAHLA